ncbi:pilus assembly protein PilN [Vibrio rotiferianus]|uniref:Pilus assembly protein PilN n=1 Tax=Vibrio rotiferianus TaxID=190895 RepID=A0A510I8P9_9VIBR|nr:PilN domain-containing protein [Vibrio rotiferianus]BBL90092.1 pilus assembly protein PilN [Vibrio rotiferianus]
MLQPVNLLPWREQKREVHRRRFLVLILFALVATFSVQMGIKQYFSYQQQQQQDRLDYLELYIADLDKRIEEMKIAEQEHSKILTRLKEVEGLQLGRNKTTEFMSLLPNTIPSGVYVDKIKMDDLSVEISGISDSTSRLATMLDRMEKSSELMDVEMHSIVHGKARFGKEFQTFRVSFLLKPSEHLTVGLGGKQYE